MPLQSTGPISLSDIQTEFGGVNPIGLNEYYQNGGIVGAVSGIPASGQISFSDFYGTSNYQLSDKAIIAYGLGSSYLDTSNLVTNTGVIAQDANSVANSRRYFLAAAAYGLDKAIIGYGNSPDTVPDRVSITNKVSNTGVIAGNTAGIGTARDSLVASLYGIDKAIFAYGNPRNSVINTKNLVSNTGTVAADTSGAGTPRAYAAAAGYGGDRAIIGFGTTDAAANSPSNLSNKISNTGTIADDTTGVGTARGYLAAGTYDKDKSIFAYGTQGSSYLSTSNKVSNTGVIANNTEGVGTARRMPCATTYGRDKVIFAYGYTGSFPTISNLVTNTGVIGTDNTVLGSGRYAAAAAGYGG